MNSTSFMWVSPIASAYMQGTLHARRSLAWLRKRLRASMTPKSYWSHPRLARDGLGINPSGSARAHYFLASGQLWTVVTCCIWLVSCTSDTSHAVAVRTVACCGRVEDGRGSLGPNANAPFPMVPG